MNLNMSIALPSPIAFSVVKRHTPPPSSTHRQIGYPHSVLPRGTVTNDTYHEVLVRLVAFNRQFSNTPFGYLQYLFYFAK